MAFWMELLAIVLEALVPVVCAVVGVLLIKWLKEKGVKEDEIQYFENAYDLLVKAVLTTNQTWVDSIKSAGNGLSKEQQEEARQKTIETFKAMLTDEVELAIEKIYGSIDRWIELNLESAVGLAKN